MKQAWHMMWATAHAALSILFNVFSAGDKVTKALDVQAGIFLDTTTIESYSTVEALRQQKAALGLLPPPVLAP